MEDFPLLQGLTAAVTSIIHCKNMALSSTSYSRKWKSGNTKVVRVPERILNDILRIAHKLDESQEYRVSEEADALILEIQRLPSVAYAVSRPINVACIPQRSPFRYPGGKTWLIPYIRDWLRSKPTKPARLIEPFAGGAIVSLTTAFECLARHVIFGELDEGVSAVWRMVLNGHADWLAKKILSYELSESHVRKTLETRPTELRDLAFQTILRNRVQRGGILAPGAGLVKSGENGRGINSRWYPATLANRIREINLNRDKITFVQGDGMKLIEEHKHDQDAVFYIDPPYTVAARRLYAQWKIDHELLFEAMRTTRGDFLMSYDNTAEVIALAKKFGFESKPVAMKSTHHAKMTELLIGRDLSWLSASAF